MPDGSGDPEGMRMVHTLAKAYVPVFGPYAMHLFLAGAVAVLYSTFYAGNAALARIGADALRVFGFIGPGDKRRHDRAVSLLCVILPLTALAIYLTGSDPVVLVLTSGVMQSLMLPMLGIAALYFRHRRSDPLLKRSATSSLLLWVSCLGLLVAGAATAYGEIRAILVSLLR